MTNQQVEMPARLTIREALWASVAALGIALLLYALLSWGASYVFATYDGSHDQRTWGGGPPRSEHRASPLERSSTRS